MNTKSTFRTPAGRFLRHLVLVGFGLVMIYPLLWMISSSFKPEDEIFTDKSLIPKNVTLENYVHGWTALPNSFATFFINSGIIVAGAIVGNLFACSLAAFAFARLKFPLRKLWFSIMLGMLMLPHHVILIPQYILFSKLGWVNTFLPLIVPKFLATDAFFIFLMVQFIRTLPRELDEAARIDGCGFFGTFFRVILPLARPALATTAIFTFIWTYNDFLTPLIYLSSPEKATVPLALRSFMDAESGSSFGPLFAMSVVALAPIFGFFIAAQKYLVRGVATTGLK
ncbi:carbohydrate ABC transporter permease [Rhizomonospora bruguierae]|uniref:carbohydrate ABC transporter permease n=1 Tax=Rhizomonospora bruguierae TaxID=1581705 RepID=UPI0020BDBB42|nr:carbohydrate ABC transporter permease [Micromonospora sp. NBRC 107566]